MYRCTAPAVLSAVAAAIPTLGPEEALLVHLAGQGHWGAPEGGAEGGGAAAAASCKEGAAGSAAVAVAAVSCKEEAAVAVAATAGSASSAAAVAGGPSLTATEEAEEDVRQRLGQVGLQESALQLQQQQARSSSALTASMQQAACTAHASMLGSVAIAAAPSGALPPPLPPRPIGVRLSSSKGLPATGAAVSELVLTPEDFLPFTRRSGMRGEGRWIGASQRH